MYINAQPVNTLVFVIINYVYSVTGFELAGRKMNERQNEH